MTPKQTRQESRSDDAEATLDAHAQQDAAASQADGEEGEARNADGPQPTGADGAEGVRGSEGSGEVDAMRDRYLRLAAEFDNYRKRTERERTESWGRAQAQLVERLLDAIDDLERVARVDPESTSAGSLLEGVQLVERKLIRQLEGAGLEVIDAADQPFDPSIHEAIVSTPTEDESADDTVAEVFQKGYSFKGNLIRPARVRVHQFGS